jgi:hypothetical protein
VSAIREKLDALELSGRERDVANAIHRLVRDVGVVSARLTHVQIFRASGRRGKDLGDVLAKLERMRILVYEKGPEGTRYWLNPRTEDWGGVSLMTQRDWDNLVAEVRAVEIAAQRKLDLVTEQPSLKSLVANVAGSAEDCTTRESVAVRHDKTLHAGADSRTPLPSPSSPQSSARSGNRSLRERVRAFVGEEDHAAYWARDNARQWVAGDLFRTADLFLEPRAKVLEASLNWCAAGVHTGEVKVKTSRGAMLWNEFQRAWERTLKSVTPGSAAELARASEKTSPENRAS